MRLPALLLTESLLFDRRNRSLEVTLAAELDESRIDWIRLHLINGLGPRLRQSLLDRFGSPTHVLKASKQILMSVPGIGSHLADSIFYSNNRLQALAEVDNCQRNGFKMMLELEQNYPQQLSQIPDPPGVLYSHGELVPSDQLSIAIVGTRHASKYGLRQAERLSFGLAKAGYTIVSGLARGIDTIAHEAALAAGGRTLAVLGSGLLSIYPPENRMLAERISQRGAVLTENGLEHKPKGSSFPQRNRIITGLSLGVVVVEAGKRSGALISARHALEQNREVFAIPGRVDSRTSVGCHDLIRDGAKLVEHVDHVIEELGPLAQKTTDDLGNVVHHPAELRLNEQERAVLNAIDDDSVSIDSIVENTGLPVSRVLSTISVLEMNRMIQRHSGSKVSRS